jgi:cytochrome c5
LSSAAGSPASPAKVSTPTIQPTAPAAVVQRAAVQPGVLPQGAGRNVAQRLCGSCHSLVLVTAVGHTEAEWDAVVARMEANGMQASADDINTVIDYLSKALPPR